MLNSPRVSPAHQAAQVGGAIADAAAVLVVDDNPTNLSVLSDLLDSVGFEVRVAKSGQAALDRVAFAAPDLILLDVMMPGIDGFETCRRLQANPDTCEIPVIFMTALADVSDKVKGLSLGAVDYITKPFQQEEVLARVRVHLKLSRLQHQLATANQTLEARVTERTADLNQALEDLKAAQVRLIQTEQLSSVGALTAGASHEIGNAANFIVGNLAYVGDTLEQLLAIVRLYRDRDPHPGGELGDRLADCDVDFVTEDLPPLLKSLQSGAQRLQSVTETLNQFTQSSDLLTPDLDLNRALDRTLTLLQHQLKGRGDRPPIRLVRHYGDLPPWAGYGALMHQALLQVLMNAIAAIEARWIAARWTDAAVDLPPPTITITTIATPTHCNLTIQDNGIGMDEVTRSRAFDPFFTTNPNASGLGLALVYTTVVEKHGGTVSCASTPHQGTTLTLQFPRTDPTSSS